MHGRKKHQIIVQKIQVFWVCTQFRWKIFTDVSKKSFFFIKDLWTLTDEGTMLLRNACK